MIEVGRLCIKIAGRDAGKKCVIVESIDDNYVTIDGATRRRKCNVRHLEPLNEVLKIKSGASHNDIAAEFKKLEIEVWETKPKTTAEKPKKQRKVKVKEVKEKAVKKTTPKPVEKVEEKKVEKSTEKPSEKVAEKPTEKKEASTTSKPKKEKQTTIPSE